MKRKAFVLLTSLLLAVLMSLTGCRRYEQIRIVSGDVESVKMNGFRSVDLVLNVVIENPVGKVEIKNAEGTLKHFGKVLGKVSLAPLSVRPRTTAGHRVEACVELAEGLGLKELMKLASPNVLNECTVDIAVKGKVAGVAVKRNFSDVPLKKLLENSKNEKI